MQSIPMSNRTTDEHVSHIIEITRQNLGEVWLPGWIVGEMHQHAGTSFHRSFDREVLSSLESWNRPHSLPSMRALILNPLQG